MLERLVKLMHPTLHFADDGAGGGDRNDDKDKGDKVDRAEYDKAVADKARLADELEDLRLEVFSPEYLEYVEAKGKGGDKNPAPKPAGEKKPDISADDFEKLSKKDLFEKAKAAAKAEVQEELDTMRKEEKAQRDSKVQREIAEFAESHEDFDKFRPIMYGISLDPKHKSASLSKLYELAKEHVKKIHMEPSAEEKAKAAKAGGEKPGGASESYEELRKLSKNDAAAKALAETKEKLGDIPQG